LSGGGKSGGRSGKTLSGREEFVMLGWVWGASPGCPLTIDCFGVELVLPALSRSSGITSPIIGHKTNKLTY
jgi:hypothetical protein